MVVAGEGKGWGPGSFRRACGYGSLRRQTEHGGLHSEPPPRQRKGREDGMRASARGRKTRDGEQSRGSAR